MGMRTDVHAAHNCVTAQTKKILQLLRLRQINNGVFVRVRVSAGMLLRLLSAEHPMSFIIAVSHHTSLPQPLGYTD